MRSRGLSAGRGDAMEAEQLGWTGSVSSQGLTRYAASTGEDLQPYFDGEKLYGDDFGPEEIARWFDDEKEAYVNLKQGEHYVYPDRALNIRYGFRFLPERRFPKVLGLGSAYGDELLPILQRIDEITIVEPSTYYARADLLGVPMTTVPPRMDGSLPSPDDSFDLATCFGVLHHLPRVTRVVRELYRCLKPGAYLLTREPIISMGDWRRPRPGTTKRERGIPLNLFRKIISDAGFQVEHENRCCSSLVAKASTLLNRPVYTSMPVVLLDEIICSLLPRRTRYHPTTLVEKLMVMNVFYVLRKPLGAEAPGEQPGP